MTSSTTMMNSWINSVVIISTISRWWKNLFVIHYEAFYLVSTHEVLCSVSIYRELIAVKDFFVFISCNV